MISRAVGDGASLCMACAAMVAMEVEVCATASVRISFFIRAGWKRAHPGNVRAMHIIKQY